MDEAASAPASRPTMPLSSRPLPCVSKIASVTRQIAVGREAERQRSERHPRRSAAEPVERPARILRPP